MSDTVNPIRDDTSDHSLIKSNDLVISTISANMAAYGYIYNVKYYSVAIRYLSEKYANIFRGYAPIFIKVGVFLFIPKWER